MADDIFLRFLKTLPEREQKLYLFLTSYHEMLHKFGGAGDKDPISNAFKVEITKLVEMSNSPIYEPHQKRDERAEKSVEKLTSKAREAKLKVVREIDRQLDDKLGGWASSFSDDEDEDTEKRLDDSSDLSSHDGDEKGILVTDTQILTAMLDNEESTVQIVTPVSTA